KQGRALILDEGGERPLDVARSRLGSSELRGVIVVDRLQRRTPRQRAQPVAIEIGQNRIEPASNVATVKKMLRPQRPHQRVLHEIVGKLAITRERTRITA